MQRAVRKISSPSSAGGRAAVPRSIRALRRGNVRRHGVGQAVWRRRVQRQPSQRIGKLPFGAGRIIRSNSGSRRTSAPTRFCSSLNQNEGKRRRRVLAAKRTETGLRPRDYFGTTQSARLKDCSCHSVWRRRSSGCWRPGYEQGIPLSHDPAHAPASWDMWRRRRSADLT
jgi:hypothetical protein